MPCWKVSKLLCLNCFKWSDIKSLMLTARVVAIRPFFLLAFAASLSVQVRNATRIENRFF